MDWYRKKLAHFKWNWLKSYKGSYHSGCGAENRKHDRVATKLARAHAKREVRKEISSSIEAHEQSWLDFLDCTDKDCIDCDPSRLNWLWFNETDKKWCEKLYDDGFYL